MQRPTQTAEASEAARHKAVLTPLLRLATRGLRAQTAVAWMAEGGLVAGSASAAMEDFCAAALARGGTWLLTDASDEPDFTALPLRFRVAVPLRGASGQAVGVLAVLDGPPRAGLAVDQQAMLEDCAAAASAVLAASPAPRDRLLRIVAEAPSFAAAVDATMTMLRDATGSLLCLFFRLAPDGRRLQLVSGQGNGPFADGAHVAGLRALDLDVHGTAVGLALLEDRQIIVDDLGAEALRRWPGAALDATRGMAALDATRSIAAMVLTPVTMASERCCIAFGFGPGRDDLPQVAALLREAAGALHPLLRRLRDTEELEERLRQAQRLEAIGQLTGGVAHDFNNLLTVILGNAELLAEGLEANPDLVQLAQMTMAAAQRGAALTSRLLAFSRRQTLDPSVVDLRLLLADLLQMLRRTLGEHVETELVHGEGLWPALIDAPQLENAVLNLCLNARDAMPAGGKLVVETANVRLDAAYARRESEITPGDYVMIAVSDTGTGMTPEVAARAVEPFFTTKEVGEGSGLGLSMVFGFVKQSGGHLKIYSEAGRGTTVKLYLPRADSPVTGAARPVQPVLPRGAAERLLLVEDDPLVRNHVAAQLRDLGYQVVLTSNAAEALEALCQPGPFDLLFTDVVMPGGLHGPALAEAARRLRPGLRVLFTSGYTENGIIHHGRLDTGVLLLNKPYRRRDLAEKVRLALERPMERPGSSQTPRSGAERL